MANRGPILVTGGAGLLGSALVRFLLSVGEAVTILDDLSSGSLWRVPGGPRLRSLRGSITDPSALAAAFEGVSRIVHLAGRTSSNASADTVAEVNQRGTLAVAGLALERDLPIVLGIDAIGTLAQPDPHRSPVDAERHHRRAPDVAAAAAVASVLSPRLGRDRLTLVRIFDVLAPNRPGPLATWPYHWARALLRNQPVNLPKAQRSQRLHLLPIDDAIALLGALVLHSDGAPSVLDLGAARSLTAEDLLRRLHAGAESRSFVLDRVDPLDGLLTHTAGLAPGVASLHAQTGLSPRADLERALEDLLSACDDPFRTP